MERNCGVVDPFPSSVPIMRDFNTHVKVMHSKAKPKKLTAYAIGKGAAGKMGGGGIGQRRSPAKSGKEKGNDVGQPGDLGEMHFLIKQEAKGDLRKDARVQDFNNVVNRLLAEKGKAGRQLSLRTFSVTCLSEDCGILEWVPKTESFRSLVTSTYNPQAPQHSLKGRGFRIADFSDHGLRDTFLRCQDLYVKKGQLFNAGKHFKQHFLKNYPPVMYWWFVQKFRDPHSWFEARSRFTRTAAAWSAVGHILGLGDRHSENILVDVSSGGVVHVDFDCLFDKGLQLARPEVVPFRLTQNMVDAMGPTGYEGAFRGSMISCMKILREERELLLSVLEPFLRDPIIVWKKTAERGRGSSVASSVKVAGEEENNLARKQISIIDGRLRGVYNLKNPNFTRIQRTDGGTGKSRDDEIGSILELGVEGQVNKMITEATKSENLVQMYVGWMSWV